jgi:hypothetical protein
MLVNLVLNLWFHTSLSRLLQNQRDDKSASQQLLAVNRLAQRGRGSEHAWAQVARVYSKKASTRLLVIPSSWTFHVFNRLLKTGPFSLCFAGQVS